MQDLTYRAFGDSSNTKQLEVVLDKLVALRMDLETVCAVSTVRPTAPFSQEAATEAYEIVRSAVVDVRRIIRQCDGFDGSLPLARGTRRSECRPVDPKTHAARFAR